MAKLKLYISQEEYEGLDEAIQELYGNIIVDGANKNNRRLSVNAVPESFRDSNIELQNRIKTLSGQANNSDPDPKDDEIDDVAPSKETKTNVKKTKKVEIKQENNVDNETNDKSNGNDVRITALEKQLALERDRNNSSFLNSAIKDQISKRGLSTSTMADFYNRIAKSVKVTNKRDGSQSIEVVGNDGNQEYDSATGLPLTLESVFDSLSKNESASHLFNTKNTKSTGINMNKEPNIFASGAGDEKPSTQNVLDEDEVVAKGIDVEKFLKGKQGIRYNDSNV